VVRLLSNNTPIDAAIDGVEGVHDYLGQVGAVSEGLISDVGDAVGDGDAGQITVEGEGKRPNFRNL
jgi:hypothetical protein